MKVKEVLFDYYFKCFYIKNEEILNKIYGYIPYNYLLPTTY